MVHLPDGGQLRSRNKSKVGGEGSWRYPGEKTTRRSPEKEKGRTVLLLGMLLQSPRVNKVYFFVALDVMFGLHSHS